LIVIVIIQIQLTILILSKIKTTSLLKRLLRLSSRLNIQCQLIIIIYLLIFIICFFLFIVQLANIIAISHWFLWKIE